ncbi:MAG: AAA family ATPase [Candidatus Omnitrophica bacterium]|nr:AAA family ATPase [Candidatus Omnitrophota bacterium]
MQNFIKKFYKKKVYFIVPFLVIFVFASIYGILRRPLYQAKAIVKLENSFGIEPTSDEVLSRVLSNLGKFNRISSASSIASLKDKISIDKDASSGIMEITLRGNDYNVVPKLAREIANIYVLEVNAKASQLKRGIIKNQEIASEEYKSSLKKELAEAKKQLEESEGKMERIQDQERGVVDNVSELKAQLAELERTREDFLKIYTPAYPDVVRIDATITALKKRLEVSPKESDGRLKVERELKDAQKIYNTLKENWDEVNLENIEELKNTKGAATVISYTDKPVATTHIIRKRTIFVMGFAASFLAGLITALIAVFLDTAMLTAQEVFSLTHIPVAGTIPYFKSFSLREMKIKSKGNLLLEYESDNSVIEPYRLIYTYIRSGAFTAGSDRKAIFFTSAERGEGKTITASNLALVMARSGKKVLLIDSNLSSPSINILFGIKGRRPGFTDLLNKGVTVEDAICGVTEFLLGGLGVEKAIKFKGLDRLKIITSGSPVSDGTWLIRSERMRLLINEFKSTFDYVILDGPSILHSADISALVSECDASLMVYLSGKTSKSSVRSAILRLNPSQGNYKNKPLNGIVLNQCI